MTRKIKDRKQRAANYFLSGYNCAQSVLLAYADLFQLDETLAKRLSAPFGGGMGRMREVCGALSGAFMLVGLKYPADDPEDKAAKTENYTAVQRVAEQFRTKFGSIICRDLLQLKQLKEGPIPNERSKEYYTERPCLRFVEEAAEIIGEELMCDNNL